MANCFEEVRNAKGVLYKLKGKLSDSKEASVTLVPRTKLVYMHINDQSNAYQNGTFDKTKSTFVSLSLPEVYTLGTMLTSMDPKVAALINNNVGRPTGTGRKKNPNGANDAEQLLAEFNQFQAQPISQQMVPTSVQPAFNNYQQSYQQPSQQCQQPVQQYFTGNNGQQFAAQQFPGQGTACMDNSQAQHVPMGWQTMQNPQYQEPSYNIGHYQNQIWGQGEDQQ